MLFFALRHWNLFLNISRPPSYETHDFHISTSCLRLYTYFLCVFLSCLVYAKGSAPILANRLLLLCGDTTVRSEVFWPSPSILWQIYAFCWMHISTNTYHKLRRGYGGWLADIGTVHRCRGRGHPHSHCVQNTAPPDVTTASWL